MPQIQELPDDCEDSLHLNPSDTTSQPALTPKSPPVATSPSVPFPIVEDALIWDGTTPVLPPHMVSVRSHTADEVVQMMKRTPLFMTSLENSDNGENENVELEALRALQYEGTPAEIAQGFKEQGNEMVKVKRWKDGQEFYTKGIAVLAQKRRDRQQSLNDSKETSSDAGDSADAQKEVELEEACYVNRAFCNLELKNYRSTTLDCAAALRLNSKNVKAYYRSSSALFALDKLADASDACTRGLTLDPKNNALKTLGTKINGRADALTAAQRRKRQEAELVQKQRVLLATALNARSIRTRSTSQPPDMEDATIHLAPDPLSPTSTLHFPVVLLYPLHAQSDFIKAFPETDTVPLHLDYTFPLPWDEKQEYTVDEVEFFMETGNGGLIKMGRNVSLGKVLGSEGVEVLDGIVRINVLLKGKTAGWIEEIKRRKGK